MRQHIGTTVYASGESGAMKIEDYHGRNKHGSHMFLCRLKSGVTRLYSGQRLVTRVGRKSSLLLQVEEVAA